MWLGAPFWTAQVWEETWRTIQVSRMICGKTYRWECSVHLGHLSVLPDSEHPDSCSQGNYSATWHSSLPWVFKESWKHRSVYSGFQTHSEHEPAWVTHSAMSPSVPWCRPSLDPHLPSYASPLQSSFSPVLVSLTHLSLLPHFCLHNSGSATLPSCLFSLPLQTPSTLCLGPWYSQLT